MIRTAEASVRRRLGSGAPDQVVGGTGLAERVREGSEAEARRGFGLKRNRAECTDLCSLRLAGVGRYSP